MPVTTSAEAASGRSGFVVVRAWRKAMTPARLMATPSANSPSAIGRRPMKSQRSAGSVLDDPHRDAE